MNEFADIGYPATVSVMSPCLPRSNPFSSIPLFLDWYNSRERFSSMGSLKFSMNGGIHGSSFSGWCTTVGICHARA